MSQTLVIVSYRVTGPVDAFRTDAAGAAPIIAKAQGFAWKLWGLNPANGEGRSVYLFEDGASAQKFSQGSILESLRAKREIADIEVIIVPVDLALSRLTSAGNLRDISDASRVTR